jgi:putative SOS response-associated peptidase YedK
MCGRYSLIADQKSLKTRYKKEFSDSKLPRYNVAPSQVMPIILNNNTIESVNCKWGLIPSWSVNETSGTNLINIRAENLFQKNTFKTLINSQRCLIPADGFYEWKKEFKQRVPYRITLSDKSIFSFAGIWDEWEYSDGTKCKTFGIITTEAKGELQDLHNRMPVILKLEAEEQWLASATTEQDIVNIFENYTHQLFHIYKSHRIVNSSTIDSEECISPALKIYPGETYQLFE